MKITKKTAVSASTCCGGSDARKDAMCHIKKAMDCLALVEGDPICCDSIANLSVVLIDLCPEGEVESVLDVEPEVFNSDGTVDSVE